MTLVSSLRLRLEEDVAGVLGCGDRFPTRHAMILPPRAGSAKPDRGGGRRDEAEALLFDDPLHVRCQHLGLADCVGSPPSDRAHEVALADAQAGAAHRRSWAYELERE